MQVLHALFTGEDPTWEAWLNVDTSGFSGIANLGGNGIKLRRGYAAFPSPKPTQDELCQQKEEEMDDYCSQHEKKSVEDRNARKSADIFLARNLRLDEVEEAKEITKLQMGQMRLQSKELSGFSLKDLRQLEKQLSSVKAKKNQLLMEQLELSHLQEQKALLENESLHRQVAKLQGFVTPTEKSEEMYLEYYPIKREVSPDKVAALASGEFEKEDSDVTLHLGPPCGEKRKRKAYESESGSPTVSP